MKPDFLIIDNHNFTDYPFGGPLTFARNMMQCLGNRIGLVGTTNDRNDPLGEWFEKELDGTIYMFFACRLSQPTENKPIVPNKISDLLALKKYMKQIRSLGVLRIFVQTPDAMMAVASYSWDSICFRFTGVFNPVQFSKYTWAKPLAGLYERIVFSSVDKAKCILATADDRAIGELVERSRGILSRDRLHKFPTRVNLELFKKWSKSEARAELDLPPDVPVFLYCARISWTKGWDLILGGFLSVIKRHPDALLLMVGGGEDIPKVEKFIAAHELPNNVKVYGRQSREEVVKFYSAADVYCVGSYIEGWSNSMLEALAAGCSIVSTDVSGAHDLIESHRNGYVCDDRDITHYGECLLKAVYLRSAEDISWRIAVRYDASELMNDLLPLWSN